MLATKEQLEQAAQEALANCKPKFDGCMIYQGTIDDRGYGIVRVEGKKYKVHRLVKLYGFDRDQEHIDRLDALRLVNTCPKGLNICVEHWQWKQKRGPEYFESSDELRGVLERAGYL